MNREEARDVLRKMGEVLCECPNSSCAPHRIVLGKLCGACSQGRHRGEGEIGTATHNLTALQVER